MTRSEESTFVRINHWDLRVEHECCRRSCSALHHVAAKATVASRNGGTQDAVVKHLHFSPNYPREAFTPSPQKFNGVCERFLLISNSAWPHLQCGCHNTRQAEIGLRLQLKMLVECMAWFAISSMNDIWSRPRSFAADLVLTTVVFVTRSELTYNGSWCTLRPLCTTRPSNTEAFKPKRRAKKFALQLSYSSWSFAWWFMPLYQPDSIHSLMSVQLPATTRLISSMFFKPKIESFQPFQSCFEWVVDTPKTWKAIWCFFVHFPEKSSTAWSGPGLFKPLFCSRNGILFDHWLFCFTHFAVSFSSSSVGPHLSTIAVLPTILFSQGRFAAYKPTKSFHYYSVQLVW